MSLFQVIELDQSKWWAVFIVNPKDISDRYLVTSTFSKKGEAVHFCSEMNRIVKVQLDEDIQIYDERNQEGL